MSKPVTELKNRLTLALSIRGMTPIELSEKTGISKSSISQYMSGYSKPKNDRIYLISNALNISETWLLGYNVPMEREEESEDVLLNQLSKRYRQLILDYHSLDTQGQNVVQLIINNELKRVKYQRTLENQIATLKEKLKKTIPTRILAYHGKIAAAGKSVEFSDIMAGTREYPLTEQNRYADYTIGVSGDSMEPTFYDGDIVFVKETTDLHIGDIGIFQKDNSIYIKEVGEDGLISHNPKYPPIKTEDSRIICMGKVLGKAK